MLRIFKNKFFIIFLITILIFITIGVSSRPSSRLNWVNNIVTIPLTPLQRFFSYTGEQIQGTLTLFSDIKALKKENQGLQDQVDRLKKENMELLRYKEENKQLSAALNLKNQFTDYTTIGANVIAKDPGNWFSIFRVDRGMKDGIVTNGKNGAVNYYPVITGGGLVGVIINADMSSAKVSTIIDPDSSISAVISKTRDQVIVKGDLTLKNQGYCRMDNIPPDADITVGDTVETSGISVIFPKGILIGRIHQIMQSSSDQERYAIIEPAVDFKRLEEVLILINKGNNGGGR